MDDQLESSAAALVADGKGILAADETVPTLTKRFDALGSGRYTDEMDAQSAPAGAGAHRRDWHDD